MITKEVIERHGIYICIQKYLERKSNDQSGPRSNVAYMLEFKAPKLSQKSETTMDQH